MKSVKEFGQYVFSSVESPKVKKMIRYGQYHSCLLPLAFLMYYKNSFFSFFFGWILDLAFAIYRLFSASPARLTTQAWSYQQASCLMQDLVILAESKGISSSISLFVP